MNKREAMNVAWNVRVNGLDMWLGRKEDKEQIKAALRWFEEAARSWPEAIGYECTTTEGIIR